LNEKIYGGNMTQEGGYFLFLIIMGILYWIKLEKKYPRKRDDI
jgi:hypothetical protein